MMAAEEESTGILPKEVIQLIVGKHDLDPLLMRLIEKIILNTDAELLQGLSHSDLAMIITEHMLDRFEDNATLMTNKQRVFLDRLWQLVVNNELATALKSYKEQEIESPSTLNQQPGVKR